ncbi:MAG: hypothetical protein ACTSY1_09125 [Alphaproteobacteria bacterium]
MTRKLLAHLPAAALAATLAMGALASPAMAQGACLDEAEGGTRALLKQAVACQQEVAKATSALADKTAANTAALGVLAKDLAALKSDVATVRGDMRQLGASVAAIEVLAGDTNKKLAQPAAMPDISAVSKALGQRFDTLAARMEKLLAESRRAAPSN